MTSGANAYGSDFWLGGSPTDLDPSMRLVSGRDLLSQSLVCRFSTGRGTVIDCPNDCFDIRDELSDGMTQSQINALFPKVQQEALKDQRVQSCTVTGSFSVATSTLTLVLSIQSLYGPFKLVLQVSAVSVTILNANLPEAA